MHVSALTDNTARSECCYDQRLHLAHGAGTAAQYLCQCTICAHLAIGHLLAHLHVQSGRKPLQ